MNTVRFYRATQRRRAFGEDVIPPEIFVNFPKVMMKGALTDRHEGDLDSHGTSAEAGILPLFLPETERPCCDRVP